VSTKYVIQVEGKGVSAADAQSAYEALVLSLRGNTDAPEDGGEEPHGSLKHTDLTEEQATDVS
jgi:hypothetical protein